MAVDDELHHTPTLTPAAPARSTTTTRSATLSQNWPCWPLDRPRSKLARVICVGHRNPLCWGHKLPATTTIPCRVDPVGKAEGPSRVRSLATRRGLWGYVGRVLGEGTSVPCCRVRRRP